MALLPRLRRFACGLTRSVDDADDLLHEALERALRRIDRFEEGTRLDSWMFRIIQNIWIDQQRARKVRGETVDASEIGETMGEDGVQQTESRIMLRRVQSLLELLPADQRVVLLLVSVDGLSYAEAAKTLGVPTGTVMSRLARARRKLHDLVQQGQTAEAVPASPAG